ncbi:MAG: DEAD/DEAH box helicase, partial [Desulfobacterales bacterium]|nr:DEAD/DEAH box helicase [Desulfobacterales bacterium]
SHQAQAIDLIRNGQHVVMATPTASGKSLVYTVPILEKVLANPESRALYLSPLKALAQDQHRAFAEVDGKLVQGRLTAAIYDGDTTAWFRKKIRQSPPNILLTNPEMVHLALLAYHRQWQTFFANLDYIVIDEVHTYRGLLGSHLAQVFRRLQRICRYYGSDPVYICCSATVANPVELVHQLTGVASRAVTRSGAPRGSRHVVMLNPVDGPVQATIQLLKAALQRGLRTIVYTQSRKLTELLAIWVGERSGGFKEKISAYRAGLLPEERRDIERKLAAGDLLAVITTSALELGIDIGDLDLCILVGYPGSIVATWQRGGRVGRGGQVSAIVVVAGEDALDQYFMRNPEIFLNKGPEAAVVNPDNPDILARHVTCAAAEFPLVENEPYLQNPAVAQAVRQLLDRAQLLQSNTGDRIYASRKMPHREVDLRGGGHRFTIVDRHTGNHRGEIDGLRVFRETHPGAIYLHRGETLLVKDLDLEQRIVRVGPARVDYYTKVRTTKETDIIEVLDEKHMGCIQVSYGHLRITEQVTGYEKWQIRGRRKMNIIPLELPPHIFETQGVWFDIPLDIQDDVEKAHLHFMGGIHAVEHAAIGIFPLLVMADRNDLGGISTPYHHQVGRAAIFIYDGIAGGAGLSREAFVQIDQLFSRTLEAVDGCPCENGCPACVHSPKCGSGNRPIDKTAAHFILQRISRQLHKKEPAVTGVDEKPDQSR